MPKRIAASNFVKRQTPESEFSHFAGTWEELEIMTLQSFVAGRYTQGYRDGVLEVPVDPEKFYSNIVQLKEGDMLAGTYKPRQAGEEPRKSVHVVGGRKSPAASVVIILYRHDVLAETNEPSCDSDWEIISINASYFPEGVRMPMSVGTLMANHFQWSGGTATNMTDAEFVKALKKSAEFWKDKALAAPAN